MLNLKLFIKKMKNQKLISFSILALLLIVGGYKYYTYKNPEKFPEVVQKEQQISEMSVLVSSSEVNHPEIIVDRPVNGTTKGVIEVGASGFNAFAVNMDKQKNWELLYKEFGESLAIEGFATTADVHQGMKSYLGKIFEKGVNGKNVHFVMSSGALKHKNSELIAKAIEEKGYVVNRVTPEKEGKYALIALLPKAYKNNSFVIDIGSGNTKVSFYDGAAIKSFEGPGAKYYQNGMSDEQVFNEIKNIVSKIPASKRENCFIIGGVPFEMAKEARDGDQRFTYLKSPDDYSFGDNVKLKSGLNIYRAIIDGTGCSNYIFDWDANFTIGFLLSLN